MRNVFRLLALGLLLSCRILHAVAALDATAGVSGVSEISMPLTVASNSNRQLAVFVYVGNICGVSTPATTSVTYAGVALTLITSATNGSCTGNRVELWAMPAGTQPSTGTNNVIVTLASPVTGYTDNLRVGAVSAYNVHQTTTFTSTVTNSGNSATASATLSSSGANDLVIGGAYAANNMTTTGHTILYQEGFWDWPGMAAARGFRAAGGTTALSYNVTASDYWIMLGASFKAATASTATYDTSTSTLSNGSVTTRQRSDFTVGPGIDRALAVSVHVGANCASDTQPTVSGITYGGVALTQLIHQTITGCTEAYSDLWSLPPGTQPNTGSNELVVSLGGHLTQEGSLHVGIFSANGVDQTTTYTSTNNAFAIGTTASVTLSSSGANDLVFTSVCDGGGVTSTTNSQRWISNQSADNACDNSGGSTAPGGTTSPSWTVVNDYWHIIAGSFKASTPASAGQTKISSGNLFYSNGSRWLSLDHGDTAVGCTPAGQIRWNSGSTRAEYCNGTTWRTMMTSDTQAGAGTAGWMRYVSGKVQVHNGTAWVNTAPCGSGISDGAYCYYLDPGAGGSSCSTICTNVGKSCNLTGTQAVAGQTECKRLIESFGTTVGTQTSGATNYSCATNGTGTTSYYTTAPGSVTCAATGASRRRICACD